MPKIETSTRRRRSDARDNTARIIAAGRVCLAEHGRDMTLQDVARRAEISVATVYRHVSSTENLVRMVFEHFISGDLLGVTQTPTHGTDSLTALWTKIDSVVDFLTKEPWIIATFVEYSQVTDALSARISAPMYEHFEDAQNQGTIRADAVKEDIPALVMMLVGAAYTSANGTEGWRRYSQLLRESLRPDSRYPLPSGPVEPFMAGAIDRRFFP